MNRLWVSDPNPGPGDTITVCLTILVEHDTTQEIVVRNPATNETVILYVDMDQDGHGCTTWTVPQGWATALLQHPASDDYAIVIQT